MKGIYLMAVKVIGAGLAGCEAAWQLAQAGIDVELYEMKPKKFTPAHKYKGFAELVCSNSLKADRIDSAAGMLKEEMRRLGSVTMECAAETKVSAGGALAVDRKKFSDMVTAKIMENPHITVIEEEVTDIPDGDVIIATGPLTSNGLAESIGKYAVIICIFMMPPHLSSHMKVLIKIRFSLHRDMARARLII